MSKEELLNGLTWQELQDEVHRRRTEVYDAAVKALRALPEDEAHRAVREVGLAPSPPTRHIEPPAQLRGPLDDDFDEEDDHKKYLRTLLDNPDRETREWAQRQLEGQTQRVKISKVPKRQTTGIGVAKRAD